MAAGIERVIDTVHELGHAVAVHARRTAGLLSMTARRLGEEAKDLAWDCRDVLTTRLGDGAEDFEVDPGVGAVDLGFRAR